MNIDLKEKTKDTSLKTGVVGVIAFISATVVIGAAFYVKRRFGGKQVALNAYPLAPFAVVRDSKSSSDVVLPVSDTIETKL